MMVMSNMVICTVSYSSYSDLNRRENEPLKTNRKEAVAVPKSNPWSRRMESAKKDAEEEPFNLF